MTGINSNKKQVLELGCGDQKHPDSVGIDRVPGPNVDVVHDLNQCPWPFKDNTFDEIRMSQIIEHLDDLLKIMSEIHRISKPSATVYIWTPHYSSHNSWTDLTHRQHLGYRSMDQLTDQANYNYTDLRFSILRRRITFGKSLLCWPGRLIASLSPEKYERHFAYLFPAQDVEFELQVVKRIF
jgi:SAM-dependent methyltransferase